MILGPALGELHPDQQCVSFRELRKIARQVFEVAKEDWPLIPTVTGNEEERWLPIVGCEGRYEVSDQGRIRSLLNTGGNLRLVPLILKPRMRNGRPVVTLRENRGGKTKCSEIAPLVLTAFIGPRPTGMEACHDPDPNPTNNRLKNLRWDTRKANIRDAMRYGMFIGEKCGYAKLTETEVRLIRELRGHGVGVHELGRRFGVHHSTIQCLLSGKSWSHVK
jgi:hypothetical protein